MIREVKTVKKGDFLCNPCDLSEIEIDERGYKRDINPEVKGLIKTGKRGACIYAHIEVRGSLKSNKLHTRRVCIHVG